MIQFRNQHITVFQSALFQTNSAVVETKELIVVVDPTWLPNEVEEIRSYVERIRAGRRIYVIYTHADFDHILGCGAFPDAKMIGSRAMAELEDKQQRVEQILQFDATFYLERNYPLAFPALHHEIDEQHHTLQVGNTRLSFYITPGHTHDGIACVIEPLGILIAGDYLSDVEFPFIEDSYAYERTLAQFKQIIEEHRIKLVVPGHGRVTDCTHEMNRRIDDSAAYIASLRKDMQERTNKLEGDLKPRFLFYRELKNEHESNKDVIRKELNIDS